MLCTMPKRAETKSTSRFDSEFLKLALLGQGAFGEVWRCQSLVDQKEYAVKVIPYQFDESDGHLNHPAVREARAWAATDHPNAVRYHAAWVEVGPPLLGNGPPSRLQHLALPSPEPETTVELFDQSRSPYSSYSDVSDSGVVFQEESVCSLQLLPVAASPQPLLSGPMLRRATLYVQMELLTGGTLHDWIQRRNATLHSEYAPEAQLWQLQAWQIFRQLVAVTGHLHAKGIVHRDLKPANVLLAMDGGVRLGDFGLARSAEDAPDVWAGELHGVTGTRGVGTPAYASPEQLHGRGPVGTKADIFALGVILVELLCPVRTQAERAEHFAALRRDDSFSDLMGQADAVHAGAAQCARRMTAQDPDRRPSAEELLRLLDGLLGTREAVTTCDIIDVSHYSSGSRIENAAVQQCAEATCDASDTGSRCKVPRCRWTVVGEEPVFSSEGQARFCLTA